MKMKSKIAAAIIGGMVMFNIESALCGPVVSAVFDWSTLTVSGGSIHDSDFSHLTLLDATDNNDYNSEIGFDFNSTLSASSGQSYSEATESTLGSYASNNTDDGGYHGSNAARVWSFVADQSALVTFSIEYALYADNLSDNKNASVSFALQKVINDEEIANLVETLELAGSKSGLLSFTATLDEDETYYLIAMASATAGILADSSDVSVPEPSVVSLFIASALMGVLVLSRRKSALAA